MKKAGVGTPHEFDQKLRTLGTSLEREKRAFIERTLAQEWIRQQVKRDEEITYDQMVAYYREHLTEFTTPARAQWEELMVRYCEVSQQGRGLRRHRADGQPGVRRRAACRSGQGRLRRRHGGQRRPCAIGPPRERWPARHSTRPCSACRVGQLSPIIAGPQRLPHHPRNRDARRQIVTPFLEAQVDIKKKIVEQRSQKQFREYMAKLEDAERRCGRSSTSDRPAAPHSPPRRRSRCGGDIVADATACDVRQGGCLLATRSGSSSL